MRRPAIVILGCALLCACAGPSPERDSAGAEAGRIAELNTQLAIAYMRDGDNEQALNKLERATAADSGYAPAWNALGLLHDRLGQEKDARQAFERALRIDPKNSDTLNNYGLFLCRHGHPEDGQAMFIRAVENPLYRSPEIALSNAGTCAMQAGDRVSAEEHFRRALQINPKLAPTLLQMAQLSFDEGRYLPARGYLQRYNAVAEHTPRSLWLGIRIEREMGDEDAVASYALRLKKAFPDAPETGLLLRGE